MGSVRDRTDVRGDGPGADDWRPVDPDVSLDGAPDAGRRPPLDIVVAVLAGGCLGGYARYAVTTGWPSAPTAFPTATLVVNLAGAFVLAALMVVLRHSRLHRHVRPLVGTGFCGALTTFSSVVVGTDELLAHGRATTAAAYLLATIAGGLAAAAAGFAVTRAAYRAFGRAAAW